MIIKKYSKYLLGVIVILMFSGFLSGDNDVYYQISKNMDLFSKVYKEITFNYVDSVNAGEFMKAGIEGMLSSLDPYTIFIDGEKKDEIDLITNGKYGGVGVSIGVRGDKVTVIEVLDGYSAQRQGIRVGDELISAAGVRITPENVEQVSSLVKGEPGTTVNLKIVRDDSKDTLNFNLVREEVIVKNLTYYGFYPPNSNNVYLRLSDFSRSAADEVKDALEDLKSKKEIKSIVLDLRGNPGGLLDVAVDICDKFLPKGEIVVETRGRDQQDDKKYYSTQEPLAGKARLVILVNGGSASASEIVTGAMQDHDRGVVLGTKTFGKGLVQTITPLNYNTSLKITTAKYYTPSGRCIQKVDYAKDNKVISDADSVVSKPFMTDDKRVVYSGGGITPDTTITYEIKGDITKQLLAQGLFFEFADHYYYDHQNETYSQVTDDDVFIAFREYLKEQKFTYTSDVERGLDKLIASVQEQKMGSMIQDDLTKAKNEIDGKELKSLDNFKDEIIQQIREELASRYSGTKGKIEVELNYDPQFQAALKILSDAPVYDKLLGIK
jgi:carboxyl-terminal processing protease